MLDRRGFTLVELAVALVVVALLAGVLLPQLIGRLRQSETAVVLSTLSSLGEAVAGYSADVGRHPRQLTFLTTPISATTQDLCGFTVPDPSAWRGPYLNRAVSSAGIRAGTSVVSDTLSRAPTSSNANPPPGEIVITVREVDLETANEVNARLDGDGSLTAGSVRWTAGVSTSRGTLTYRIPIRGC